MNLSEWRKIMARKRRRSNASLITSLLFAPVTVPFKIATKMTKGILLTGAVTAAIILPTLLPKEDQRKRGNRRTW